MYDNSQKKTKNNRDLIKINCFAPKRHEKINKQECFMCIVYLFRIF